MFRTHDITIQSTSKRAGAHDLAFLSNLSLSLSLASEYSRAHSRHDGHWREEDKLDATTAAEYLLLHQALGLELRVDPEAIIFRLCSQQNSDGSWGVAPQHLGDISITVEAYLALKLLGVSVESQPMRSARHYVLAAGGVAKVRVLTRIYLAMFGLFPWEAIPPLPAQLILMPSISAGSIYQGPYWAPFTILPFIIICHHRPTYTLRSEKSTPGNYLDELWSIQMDKSTSSGFGLLGSQRFGPTAWVCSLVHTVLHGLNCLGLFNPIRRYAMRRCLSSILEYRDKSEGYRDSLSPLHGATFALILEGYSLHSEPVRRELQALEHFMLSAERGKEARIGAASLQDTSLMLGSLCDAGMRADTHRLKTSLEWLCDQLADLRSITSTTEPFNGYLATSYPDITGTAAAVVALIRQEPLFVHSTSILDALEWLLTKQNADGGWGVSSGQSSDRFLLENMCFGDMECLYDRSCPESSGHVLEAFGLFLAVGGPHKTRGENKGLLNRLALASQRAIYYLSMTQEPSGAWPGRRGRSHIYGTCAVLCGLAYFIGIKEGDRWSERDDAIFDDVHEAITWLKAIQRKDGSWGETPCTYSDSLPSGCDTASPSETAWALLALLPYVDPSTSVIIEGVKYLLKTQRKAGSHGATWIDEKYDGKPNNPSACHPLHSHYYPMMALGRFAHVSKSLLLGQHTDCSVAR